MFIRASILAYRTDISGVLTVLEKSVFTHGKDSWHALFNAGLLFCDFIKNHGRYILWLESMGPSSTLKSIFQGAKYYQPGNF